jgi:hypothetical protein
VTPDHSRAVHNERGLALVAVMAASSLLLALGLSLALTTTVEVGIAANHRDAVQTLHAADAALEYTMAELASADWNAVLAGAATSRVFDRRGAVTLPDGSRLVIGAATNRLRCGDAGACSDADMDAVTSARPWGRNNPRWTVYASGPLAAFAGDAELAADRVYVLVWIGDDPSENDAQPFRDGSAPAAGEESNPGAGALWLHVAAHGASGARRAVEAIVERDPRWPATQVRLRLWREIA